MIPHWKFSVNRPNLLLEAVIIRYSIEIEVLRQFIWNWPICINHEQEYVKILKSNFGTFVPFYEFLYPIWFFVKKLIENIQNLTKHWGKKCNTLFGSTWLTICSLQKVIFAFLWYNLKAQVAPFSIFYRIWLTRTDLL